MDYSPKYRIDWEEIYNSATHSCHEFITMIHGVKLTPELKTFIDIIRETIYFDHPEYVFYYFDMSKVYASINILPDGNFRATVQDDYLKLLIDVDSRIDAVEKNITNCFRVRENYWTTIYNRNIPHNFPQHIIC